jgi:cation diffusion facilitator family transporter
MMFFGCWEILSTALDRWRAPRVPQVTLAGFVVLGVTLVVNLFVVWIERREGARLQSELLQSDAAHTGSDVLASLLVMASFAASRAGIPWADVATAVAIVVLILRAGFVIMRNTMSTLADERRIDPLLIESLALEEPGVLEAHNVRSRGPDDDIHIDLHILVDPNMPIAEAHRIGHRVESRLRDRWPGVTDVIVHVEPALDSERGRPSERGGLEAEG